MDVVPGDAAARRESLERWAAEQQEISQPPARRPLRVRLPRGKLQWHFAAQRFADRVFDRGLDTSGLASEPEHDHPDRVGYVPSPWHVLPRALRYLGVTDRDTFVDFGCGKGRVVHQAAKRPFRRVIGVEISPVLAEIARTALAARRHQHRCRNVEIVVSDATAFRLPDDVTIGYFYHPFVNATFDAVLRNIVDSVDRHPRRVRLIYVHPVHSSQVLATGRFQRLREQGSPAVAASRVTIFESC
jgi:SAM-dependent methyltransferase